MKFNKVLIGLMAVVPFALTSCNNAISFEQAHAWVEAHYKTSAEHIAIATYFWDYHKTSKEKEDGKGKVAMDAVKAITEELDEALQEEVHIYTPIYEDQKIISFKTNLTGQEIIVASPIRLFTLTADTFKKEDYGDKAIYKISANKLTITYTRSVKYLEKIKEELSLDSKFDTTGTFVLAYDEHGRCTDLGFKTGSRFIVSGSTLNMKITLKFTYGTSEGF